MPASDTPSASTAEVASLVRPQPRAEGFARRRMLFGLAALPSLASGCAWALYPERRGQSPGGQIDTVPLIVDIIWFLPGLLPGVICLAVDFASGAIYTSGGGGGGGGGEQSRTKPPALDGASTAARRDAEVRPSSDKAVAHLEAQRGSKMVIRTRGRGAERLSVTVSSEVQAALAALEADDAEPIEGQPVTRRVLSVPEAGTLELQLAIDGRSPQTLRIDASA